VDRGSGRGNSNWMHGNCDVAPAVAAIYNTEEMNTAFCNVICVVMANFYRTTRRYIPKTVLFIGIEFYEVLIAVC
jgi:hypothetical protein